MTEPQKIESFRDNFFKSVLLSLDTNRVLTDKSKLFIHESNTIGSKKKLSGLIQPISVPEIQTIIKLANQYQIGIYPISLGKNWGYGSKLPPTEDSVVLDLSKMSKIIDYNPELAYVIIEPGVSQLQLYDFLKSQDDNHVMDPSGAGPSASVVGNILERGFGIGRYCDRFTSVAGMEVILPNGEVLKTGFWGFENSKLTGTHRWGVGPYLDGIFTQSSFGI
ncbi:MAG: FAD-dependent oxidoreductase, partial [Bdellovibrionales bacterium]|nr:FAD-dependent oxidoreductase [Bdellovibrionales bacterium]